MIYMCLLATFGLNLNNDVMTWHRRLGHLNLNDMKQFCSRNMVTGVEGVRFSENKLDCSVCMKSKIHVNPFPKQTVSKSDDSLAIIHTDI